MNAFLRPLFSCRLYTIIIRQRKKDFGESKQSQNTIKRLPCGTCIVIHTHTLTITNTTTHNNTQI